MTAKVALAAMAGALLVACGPAQDARPDPLRRPAPPVFGRFDPASTRDIDVDALPVLPEITPTMAESLRAIYRAGLARGNHPRVLAKLGDCMTENEYFLAPFSAGRYELGDYAALKPTLEHFLGAPARANGVRPWDKDSFATPSLAAAGGFNVAGPLDPTWSNPDWCAADESPLQCEFRVSKPAFAIVMFGTNDVNTTDLATYDFYLRTIISQTLDAGVIPILNTFPTRPENPAKTRQLNQIVVKVAQDYGAPLINLNRALAALPNQGVDPQDATRLSVPPDGRVDVFSSEHLRYGFTMRNLVTLQTLDAVLRAVR
ncbi:GDSL-type esterase/lipase family protein [Candidatus Roseilinea sp. NK_OTU-006]|uniref:GDSL-type esterase/lipase family protein n=1 Tax=Candidatus Roseilinea sp. NK_OTU-006 TaxID=2704250 RepID=UPI00145C9CBC|nr:SGNH/GDSL hydrolase family protein [Candidatus Roseilinea sp. NK_OTU-006]